MSNPTKRKQATIMAQFTITRLVGDRAVVAGTDVNKVKNSEVISTEEWDLVLANEELSKSTADFDAAVEAFYAPLLEAAAGLQTSLEKPDDPVSYVVIDEGTEKVKGVPRNVQPLSRDSVILRLVTSGDTSRLIWVGDSLEVTALP